MTESDRPAAPTTTTGSSAWARAFSSRRRKEDNSVTDAILNKNVPHQIQPRVARAAREGPLCAQGEGAGLPLALGLQADRDRRKGPAAAARHDRRRSRCSAGGWSQVL